VLIRDLSGRSWTWFIQQPIESVVAKPHTPTAHRLPRDSDLVGYIAVAGSFCAAQNDLGALSQRLRRLGPARPSLQGLVFLFRDCQMLAGASSSHRYSPFYTENEEDNNLVP
jgi:hypothetical protein